MRYLLLAIVMITVSDASKTSTLAVQESRQPANEPGGGLPFVFELLQTIYRFENDGTGTREVHAKVRILTQAGAQQFPELTFQYKPSSRLRKNGLRDLDSLQSRRLCDSGRFWLHPLAFCGFISAGRGNCDLGLRRLNRQIPHTD